MEKVNPKHYIIELKNGTKLEAINVFQATMPFDEFTGYCKGNALKYLMRADKKHDQQLVDLMKARRNLDFAINHLQGNLATEEKNTEATDKEFGAIKKLKLINEEVQNIERKSNKRGATFYCGKSGSHFKRNRRHHRCK